MEEKIISLNQKEVYNPGKFTRFLWWLSTAEEELLFNAVVDRNRYAIVGMTVLATWSFATLAWTYFFSTVSTSIWIAIFLGLFMGFIILTIDRALIKGINRSSEKKLLPLLFRAVLAITIGTFMAQPALLYMFKKEILLQTSLDNEQKHAAKSKQLNDFYRVSKTSLETEKQDIQNELASKYAEVANARENFIAETDGSGGTGKVGVAAVALAKKNEYQKLDAEYVTLLASRQQKINAIENDLKEINDKIKIGETTFTQYFNNGFLTQIEALNNLIKTSPALQLRYYLLVVILLLIELMPVIAKTMLPSGTYEEKATLQEALEKEMATSNNNKERELKELYNQLAHDNDADAIKHFFAFTKEDRNNKIQAFSNQWKESPDETFDGMWNKMKNEILTKREE